MIWNDNEKPMINNYILKQKKKAWVKRIICPQPSDFLTSQGIYYMSPVTFHMSPVTSHPNI